MPSHPPPQPSPHAYVLGEVSLSEPVAQPSPDAARLRDEGEHRLNLFREHTPTLASAKQGFC